MKFKFLKTTLFISTITPIAIIASSCANKTTTTDDVKTPDTKKTPGEANPITKFSVSFTPTEEQKAKGGVTFSGPTLVKAKKGAKFGSIEQPTAYYDQRPQTYWVNDAGQRITESTVIDKDMELHPYFQADISLANCVSIIALEHSMLTVVHHGTNATTTKPNILYSTDGFTWKTLTTTIISINPGEAIYIRGSNSKFNQDKYNYTSFTVAGTVHLNGSVMSLIDNGMGTAKTIPTDYCFTRLFENCSGIKVISSNFLPATTLKAHCYDSMFKGCTTLESFPDSLLPAGKEVSGQVVGSLAEGCYQEMFTNCSSIKTVSNNLLPAKTLVKDCYDQMFRNCTGITELTSGTLPATALAERCYTAMFRGCSKLNSIGGDLLSCTNLQPSCYYGMFADCTSLTDVSSLTLGAGTLSDYCYREMFYNCTNLTAAPTLNATNLAQWCYYGMFYNCTSLKQCPTIYTNANQQMYDSCYAYMFYNCKTITKAVELLSTNLADNCYRAMFYNCAALTDTYTLPATTLAKYCYSEMFYSCDALVNAPAISASTLAEGCCLCMFYDCTSLAASPALGAKTAVKACYRNMFGHCTALKKIGAISLTSLADYACFMMFMNCSGVQIDESSGTSFFTCPSTTGLTEPTTSMFQGTKNSSSRGGFPAVANYTYRYS